MKFKDQTAPSPAPAFARAATGPTLKRAAKWAALVIVVLLAVAGIAHVIMNAMATSAVEAEIEKITARGEPLRFADFAQPPVADDRNGYAVIAALTHADSSTRFVPWTKWTPSQALATPGLLAAIARLDVEGAIVGRPQG
jgi:hypothetical protein